MRGYRLDGFHLFSEILGVVGGPILPAAGAPPGWSLLVTAAGVVVLVAQWFIATDPGATRAGDRPCVSAK